MTEKTILLIGTYDTKEPEMRFLEQCIREQGAAVVTMDVSVLGDPEGPTDISKHDVASAAGMSIDEVIAQGDENKSFRVMSRGAAAVVAQAFKEGRFDAMLATGGTLGTDLALDCAQALPMGIPKYIVSTVSFSPLIPPHRFAPDVQMILWSGGLYGLNSICKSSLSQAAGAIVGSARAAISPDRTKPLIGMTSLGSSCLRYMKYLYASAGRAWVRSGGVSLHGYGRDGIRKACRRRRLCVCHGFLHAGIRQHAGRVAGHQRRGSSNQCQSFGYTTNDCPRGA